MERVRITPRADWPGKADEIGFTYHSCGKAPSDDDGVYWYEEAAYRFTAAEVDTIEDATQALHDLCLESVDYACRNPSEMDAFGIPPNYRSYVATSWMRQDPSLMGRFDLAFDPVTGSCKMLEYNADTPTLAIETSLMQWFWLRDRFPDADQFNSWHEAALGAFRAVADKLHGRTLHFAGIPESAEELQHVRYFMDLAGQAGITAKYVGMSDIGWDSRGFFVDLDGRPIRFMHKLYPWEWMATEPFGQHFPKDAVGVIEPVWKMLLSNKAILPLLWRLFPDHQNLLAASFDQNGVGPSFIAKPILAREGANMRLVRDGVCEIETGGTYGASPVVYQDAVQLPAFDGQHVVIGSWVIDGKACGMIVRESESQIVVNTSRVVPHFFI